MTRKEYSRMESEEKHLTFPRLVDYIEGKLDETDRKAIDAHLATCARCQREWERSRRLMEDVRAFEEPPASLPQRILAAVRHKKSRHPHRPRHSATLQFDSWINAALQGVRGTPQERQLLFTEDGFDLDVEIVEDKHSEAFLLRGQLLSDRVGLDELEGVELRLMSEADIERRGVTDRLGRFSFSLLPEGRYSLQVMLDDHDIAVDDLEIEDAWAQRRT